MIIDYKRNILLYNISCNRCKKYFGNFPYYGKSFNFVQR